MLIHLLRHFCSVILFYTSMKELSPTIILHVEFLTISKTDFFFEIILLRQSYQETIYKLQDIWPLHDVRFFYR